MNAYDTTRALFTQEDGVWREAEVTKAILTALIDRFGVAVVTSAVADVCADKSEDWTNSRTAKQWIAADDALRTVALSRALEVR